MKQMKPIMNDRISRQATWFAALDLDDFVSFGGKA